MKKNMYSLMLSQSIIQEVDRLAYQKGTNRSNLINQILASHLTFETPEMRIKQIFDSILHCIEETDFILLSEGNTTLSLKSPLQYKYRPNIKYTLELYKHPENEIGILRVSFRTQSQELLNQLHQFFHLFMQLEEQYIHPLFEEGNIQYQVERGRFSRSFLMPSFEKEHSNRIISEAISAYIDGFDRLIKWYLLSSEDADALEANYLHLIRNKVII